MLFPLLPPTAFWHVRQEIEMSTLVLRFGFVLALGLGIAAMPFGVFAADDKTKDTTAPDWSKYTTVTEVTGELVKADETKITLRLNYVAIKGQQNKFPPLTQYPFTPPVAKANTLMQARHDYSIHLLPESLIRTLVLPPKLDDKGKKVPYTDKEKEALKVPKGVRGYAATIADLTSGSTVIVVLIRDKSIQAEKATDDDLRVKYAILDTPAANTTTNPPKKQQ
jgi:hypothetical protein